MLRLEALSPVPPTPHPSPRRGRGGAGCQVSRGWQVERGQCSLSGGLPPRPLVFRINGLPRDIFGQMKGRSHVPA